MVVPYLPSIKVYLFKFFFISEKQFNFKIQDENLDFDSNHFFQNGASQNGLAIYIQNSTIIQIKNNLFSSNAVLSKKQTEGSVLLLENPGNILIFNSVFNDNFGISGTCISYSETSNFIYC